MAKWIFLPLMWSFEGRDDCISVKLIPAVQNGLRHEILVSGWSNGFVDVRCGTVTSIQGSKVTQKICKGRGLPFIYSFTNAQQVSLVVDLLLFPTDVFYALKLQASWFNYFTQDDLLFNVTFITFLTIKGKIYYLIHCIGKSKQIFCSLCSFLRPFSLRDILLKSIKKTSVVVESGCKHCLSRDEITVERGPGPLWTFSGTKVDRIFIAETLRGTTTAVYTYFIT